MKILVTGADGFVGSRLVSALAVLGHEVGAGVIPNAPANLLARRAGFPKNTVVRDLDLRNAESVDALVGAGWDVVVHLAAAASGAEASRDPLPAWEVNTLGTVRICESMGRNCLSGGDPLLLFVSTAEVYGAGDSGVRVETDATRPCSSYAVSKLAAESAVLEVSRRTGLKTMIARPFPHTGAGQDDRFVVPAFARRILEARRSGSSSMRVGNLNPVRDFLHVDDVVDAYCRLIDAGSVGETYNIASGSGVSVGEVLQMVMAAAGVDVDTEIDAELVRPSDVPHLVGSSTKLRDDTGWQPKRNLVQAIQEVVDAQTD